MEGSVIMGKIVYIDLTEGKIIEKEKDFTDYGRGLVTRIIREEVPPKTDRLEDENIIVLAPGLFSGTLAPSTGRLIVGTKRSKDEGIQFSNLAGTISQKLASLNIDALVLMGKGTGDIPITILIEDEGVSLNRVQDIKGLEVSPTIDKVSNLFGKKCGIIGIGCELRSSTQMRGVSS